MPDYKEMYLTMMRAADKALQLNQQAAQHMLCACANLYMLGQSGWRTAYS